jgi:rhodanese-related sulfurtransferase
VTPLRLLSGLALLLGGLAAFAGSPYRSSRGVVDVDEVVAAIAAGRDQVSALELAEWIKDRRLGLRLLDVRDQQAFDDYAIPTAEHLPLDRLSRGRFGRGDVVVLYSDDESRAAQAWVLLRATGVREAYVLRGGLSAWVEAVMEPVLAENATPAAKEAWVRVAELSRYFGGRPRIGPAAPSGDRGGAPPAGTRASGFRRRGC